MIKDFINLFYPSFCAGCNNILSTSERGICTNCWMELKKFDNSNNKCFFGRLKVESEFYAFEFVKNQILQKIIHQIKYKRNKFAAFVLGIELGKIICSSSSNIDVIIPVPISKKKKNIREFNQCDFIAKGVQQVIKKPILSDYLSRVNKMSSQINSGRYERWENVNKQFIRSGKSINFCHVLIIDDIVTSGATIHECIKEFNEIFKISVGAVAKAK